jgi:2-phospho-L-lactate/phosphoenolpyruvate guanylyltransferase
MSSPVVALVPLKSPGRAKTRLSGVDDELRASLAEAFARDVLAVLVMVCDEVVVVCDGDQARAVAASCGCRTLPDSGDLNRSLVAAAGVVHQASPGAVAVVVVADLPALTVEGLAGVLVQMTRPGSWFVPDASGLGTTLYAGTAGHFAPSFGPGSATAHRTAGAIAIEAPAGLRHDVDDLAGLAAATELGIGAHTAALVDSRDLGRAR